jgi:hypothetical protein
MRLLRRLLGAAGHRSRPLWPALRDLRSSPGPHRGRVQQGHQREEPHFAKYPLHTLINHATKLAAASGTKGSADPDVAGQLLAKNGEIDKIFRETRAS